MHTPLTDSPIYWRQKRENAAFELLQATRELDGDKSAENMESLFRNLFGFAPAAE